MLGAVSIAVALLAGCAASTESAGGGGAGPTTTTSATATTPAPRAPTSTRPPSGSRTLVLDGVAERGVEPGCVVFHAAGKQYVLVGAGGVTLTGVPMQVPIRVRATVLTGVFSYCQQGTTLQVAQITRR
jgi:hypothetical protein